jgi:hypothetical protein
LAPASPLKKMWLISCQGRDYRRLRKAPEAPLADPHAAKHTTILWWFTIRLIGGLMKHTIKIWPDGRIANFFFRNSERDLAWGHNLWGWNMWLYNDQQYDMCVCPNTEYRIIKLGKL